jgi:hypothetical protein
MTSARILERRELPVCGVPWLWLLRVVDHEAVLLGGRAQNCSLVWFKKASGVVEAKVWTADKQPVAQWLFSRNFH